MNTRNKCSCGAVRLSCGCCHGACVCPTHGRDGRFSRCTPKDTPQINCSEEHPSYGQVRGSAASKHVYRELNKP